MGTSTHNADNIRSSAQGRWTTILIELDAQQAVFEVGRNRHRQTMRRDGLLRVSSDLILNVTLKG